tara:strand:- start:353 stop:706 length:354 start_codon:yes stop_codon:yes gene_type:complete
MPAVLHCIVTDIENHRLHEQLLVWREKANADPLIQKIRELRTTVEKLTHDRYWYSNQAWEDQNRIENLLRLGSSLVEAGEALRHPTSVIPEEVIPVEDLEHWDKSRVAWDWDTHEAY